MCDTTYNNLQAQGKCRSKERSVEIKTGVNGVAVRNVYGIRSEFV